MSAVPSAVPPSFALADLYEGVCDALPDAEALVVGAAGEIVTRLTYSQLDERANRLANGLMGRGVTAGDRVGLHLRNHAEHVEAMLGVFKARAVPVNVNFRYTAEELAYLINDSTMAAVLTEPDLAPVAREAATLAGRPDLVVVERGAAYDELLAGASADRPAVGERTGDDLYLLYTGGTTGSPKGVMWRQHDIYMASFGGRGTPNRGIAPVVEPGEVVQRAVAGSPVLRRMPLCPLMHGAAAWTAWQSLLGGGAVVIDSDVHLDPPAALRLAEASEADLVMVVGDAVARPLADALATARAADPTTLPLPRLQLIASGGAVLSPAVKEQLRSLLPEVGILDSFGSSETGSQGRLRPGEGGGAPVLVGDDATTVLDVSAGGEGRAPGPVPADGTTVGKLSARGHVPLGYWGDAERTAATFPVIDGVRWAVSGDDAVIEPGGSIRVLGRGSASINTGGEKVFPEEVEGVLKGHPAVFDALVVGVPDERFGQRVSAVVALRPGLGAAPSASELAAHAREHLAGFKVPRSWVLTDHVARSASGKPDYRWARDAVLASIELDQET
jgi:3-oxocholest-4-en-26-oate---CoA ligase